MRAVILAAMVLIAGVAEAGAFAFIGSGALSCGAWTANERGYVPGGLPNQAFQNDLQDKEWVLGFLSGVGARGEAFGDNPLDGVDAEAVWAWIDNYCLANPVNNIATAAAAFYRAHPHK